MCMYKHNNRIPISFTQKLPSQDVSSKESIIIVLVFAI